MSYSKSYLYNKTSLDLVAKALLINHAEKRKWALVGEMGSGKTTLIKAMIGILGSLDHGSSPTFSIVNQYHSEINGTIFHMDLYRLKSVQEAFNAGIMEILETDNDYCFVEWPELIYDWIDESWIRLKIEKLNEETRMLVVQ
ncbi:MAG: tRNA (adenosine(37)-N6)-threonylcarbamoyltransferase complex ATPase subunit type 1 TsaE [Saprospiraceae bacterium]|nr:tRNA (adenosine(37)-N6)-threonylcarbamoyltransferase complex ATPase subunit type 1 TsaE [Saprospiraceae bacterium]